ncbi:MAG: MBOAT family O-acyltransferase [Christensenellales bacterium]
MIFSSPTFLFVFLPLVFVLYKILPKKAKNTVLILSSLLFYAWGEPKYILLMIGSVVVNYMLALVIGAKREQRISRTWIALAVLFNIGMLFFFKYTGFFVHNVNRVFGLSFEIPVIRLPIGISFYTFKAISYIVDVYRGNGKAQKSFFNVLLYISVFPQLIAGPIVKYSDMADQLQNRTETMEKTVAGLKRFTVGLAKKLLVAGMMGNTADKVFALPSSGMNILIAWLGAAAYVLQIYFDFSGYSDMAIGLCKIFGFDIKENFDYPYTAKSIKTFWRKWHISLSTWFREYLYIPLGGNRKGTFRTTANLLIVFLCTGFWHGASWTFIVWGLFHGFFLVLERVGAIKPEKFKPAWLANGYAMLVVTVGFTIFRADSMSQAGAFIDKMFTGFVSSSSMANFLSQTLTPQLIVFAVLGIIGSTPLFHHMYLKLKDSKKLNANLFEAGTMVATLLLLCICLMALSSQTFHPFIYARF